MINRLTIFFSNQSMENLGLGRSFRNNPRYQSENHQLKNSKYHQRGQIQGMVVLVQL